MTQLFSAPSRDKRELETGTALTPRFDAAGLITAVVTDDAAGALLMVAHMNDEALALTIETGIAHYYSRSRATLWKKGESSGNFQHVSEIRVDCDQDAIWLKVRVDGHGATCHTGRKSCFYRRVAAKGGSARLVMEPEAPLFDPSEVYDPHKMSDR